MNSAVVGQPKSTHLSPTYDQKDSVPLYLNPTLEAPALFGGATTLKESSDRINQHIAHEIEKRELTIRGTLAGTIIVSATGEVEDFRSFGMNKLKIEKVVREIILSMPAWRIGKQQDVPVRISQTIMLKG